MSAELPSSVHASPTKDFFVSMLTRDINVEDCLLDLLDNSIDGARRLRTGQDTDRYKDLRVDFHFSLESVTIRDNCGGILLANAENYAFHFGRRHDAPKDTHFSIGLYGIGMKRAIFKLGSNISIRSFVDPDPFEVVINVDSWLRENTWDFPLQPYTGVDRDREHGVEIVIRELHERIAHEVTAPEFINRFRKMIARDYAFILANGLMIYTNGEPIKAHQYQFLSGGGFIPLVRQEIDAETGVEISVTAGLVEPPPETAEEEKRPDTDYFGWYVVCNERIVLAGDKTTSTVWGKDAFPHWHPQYNGFMGIARLTHEDASKLPWSTTKRGVDLSSSLYRRLRVMMREATRPVLDYTNQRKSDLEAAKLLEREAKAKTIEALVQPQQMKLPNLSSNPRVKMTSVQYSRPHSEIRKVAAALGNENLTNAQVGIQTYEYFLKNEVGE